MSSCRGRAEAFARRLSSKLRTLASPTDNEAILREGDPIIKTVTKGRKTENNNKDQNISNLQPLLDEYDSVFDSEYEKESPESPECECAYLRLIETSSNTPPSSTAETEDTCGSAASSHNDAPLVSSLTLGACPALINSVAKTTTVAEPITSSPTKEKENSNRGDYIERERKNFALDQDDAEIGLAQKRQQSTIQHTQIIHFEEKPKTSPVCKSFIVVSSNFSQEVENQTIDGFQDESAEQTSLTSKKRSPTHDKPLTSHSASCVNEITLNMCTSDRNDHVALMNRFFKSSDEAKKIEILHKRERSKLLFTSEEGIWETSKGKFVDLSPTVTTDDEDVCQPDQVRRCSSLKTGKTPPGSPGRKKIVRFADVLGLDLADVKTFLDEIPTIPKSAFEHLKVTETEISLQGGPKVEKHLMPLFQQPGGHPSFLDSVRTKQVSLENAAVTDHLNLTITGTVRVRNLDFHKSVHIRYTSDNWRSFADLQANYVANSCDGFSDKFTFSLFGNSLKIGERLEFAVRFQCRGQQHWDNNYGTNYCFHCTSSASQQQSQSQPTPSHQVNMEILNPTSLNPWCNSFY